MDRKSILVIVGCLGLIMLWTVVIVPKLYPPKPLPPGATNLVSAVSTTNAAAPSSVTNRPEPEGQLKSAVAAPKPAFLASGDEETLVLTNSNARYTFTSHGGGLKLIELLNYPETVSRVRKRRPLTNNVAELNAQVLIPVLAVLGEHSVQGDGIFTLTKTESGVRAEKTLTNGLRLVKEFQLSTNYLMIASVRLENTSESARPGMDDWDGHADGAGG
jgi:YidC/Oxa1 family membrane protein insertase